jgi:hypothetical protein
LITSAVSVTPVNATTYRIAGFNWVSGLPGSYTLAVNAAGIADPAGNIGAGGTNETWQMILETPPSPTQLAVTPDTGISAGDGLTATNAVVLSGVEPATNLTVRITDQTSGQDLGTAAISNGTNFSAALSFLATGQHHLKLTAVDAAGNVSAPVYYDLFLDITPPTASLQPVSPSLISWPVTNLLVTFSKAINTNTLTAADFTLTRDGTNAGTPTILILSSNVALVSGLAPLTAASGSYTLTLGLADVQDLAGNSSAQVASTSWQNIPANQPPVITPEPNAVAVPGASFQRLLHASDPEGNHVTFSLAPDAPAGATLDTNNLFSWTPACEQGNTTNLITVWATDDGVPAASNSMSFTITVGDCLEIGVGSTVVQTGTTGSVPLTVFSSAGVTNLSFTLDYPANRFTNWTLMPSNNTVGAASVQPVNTGQTRFHITAKANSSLQGSALLGTLSFSATPMPSAFVPLTVTNSTGVKNDNTPVAATEGRAGRVVVIGLQSLLEARLGTNAERQLILYGNPGGSYQLAYRTNLTTGHWVPVARVPMTNLWQSVAANSLLPQVYYRAWEFSANPPLLELSRPTPTNAMLLLYGTSGTNYILQTTTNLADPNGWLPLTSLILSNSFQFIPLDTLTNQARYFRARE